MERPHRHHDRAPAQHASVDADKIIVLQNGMVAEQGGYDELIARGGVFADLNRVQHQAEAAKSASAA